MRLNVGDKQNNLFCLILWLGLHGFEKKRAKRKRRKKKKEEERFKNQVCLCLRIKCIRFLGLW